MFCLWRLLLGCFGLGWLLGPAEPRSEAEVQRWRERRRRFRSKVRAALAELLAEDHTPAGA
jgi:hypothetical protein